jgi:hypothetical protein
MVILWQPVTLQGAGGVFRTGPQWDNFPLAHVKNAAGVIGFLTAASAERVTGVS